MAAFRSNPNGFLLMVCSQSIRLAGRPLFSFLQVIFFYCPCLVQQGSISHLLYFSNFFFFSFFFFMVHLVSTRAIPASRPFKLGVV
ncbi:hypothetical protein IWX92DRAFT_84824 [Phyllosticta citricarpa]